MKKLLVFALVVVGGWAVYRYMGALHVEKAFGTDQFKQGEKAKLAAERAVAKADLGVLTEAVAKFRATENRFPSSLQEAVDKGYLDKVPAGVSYDPVTGEVKAAE
jgi:hypothetical protein